MSEVVTEMADPACNIIFGAVVDDQYEGEIHVTIIATGVDTYGLMCASWVRIGSSTELQGHGQLYHTPLLPHHPVCLSQASARAMRSSCSPSRPGGLLGRDRAARQVLDRGRWLG